MSQLERLTCHACGAPVAVAEGDETTCAACGQRSPLPEPYKALRDAQRLSQQDAAQLHELAAAVAKPPPAWKGTAMFVGYVVGGATLVIMAIGAIIGAVGGIIVGSRLGESAAKFCAVVGALALGVVSVPYAGEWLAAVVMHHDSSLASDIIDSATPAYRYDLVAAALLYTLGVVPLALAVHTQGNLSAITALQGRLAARESPYKGGGLCCRNCGAALDLARDALVSRCLYCGTDNLLTVPAAEAGAEKDAAKDLDAKVQDAVDQHARERADDRARTLVLLLCGLLLVPYVCAAGYLLHTVFLRY